MNRVFRDLFFGFGLLGLRLGTGRALLRPLGGPRLLLRIVRMDLLVVLAAWAAEKVKDRLSVVRTAHALSFRNWRAVIKRSTVAPRLTQV